MNEYDLFKRQAEEQRSLQREGISMQGEEQARLYAPQLKEQMAEAQAAVIAQTNPARALKIVIRGFKGEILNQDGEFEKLGVAIMNDEGTTKIASILIPFINDPMRFGNIREAEAKRIALQIVDDITTEVGINWREYGIRDPSYKDLVVDSCLALVFLTISRSVEGDEKKFLSRILLESVSGTKLPEKKSGDSIWSKMFKL